MNANSPVLTKEELAHVGEGAIGYVRKVASEDLARRFPGIPDLMPGIELWALFAANGQPILLTDEREAAFQGASENALVTVAIH